MIDLSLSETEALCKKAARGAGLSWGMAGEAANAARWLVEVGLPGPEVLLARLTAPAQEQGQFAAGPGNGGKTLGGHCPLAAGCSCFDRLGEGQSFEENSLSNLAFPLLIVPFVAQVACFRGENLSVAWDACQIVTDGERVHHRVSRDGCYGRRAEKVVLSPAAPPEYQGPKHSRCALSEDAWQGLSDLAALTYAPETEISRLRGAGGGGSDNE